MGIIGLNRTSPTPLAERVRNRLRAGELDSLRFWETGGKPPICRNQSSLLRQPKNDSIVPRCTSKQHRYEMLCYYAVFKGV
jgi:hypothetical protein